MSDDHDPVSAAIAALRARQTGQAGDHGEPGVRLASDEGARAQRMAEALLFAASEPLDVETLAARLPAGTDVRALLGALQDRYAGAGVTLVELGGRWRFQTAPDLAHLLADIREEPKKLSQAGLETLSIIAYHQPVTRAEIEQIRGVQTSRGSLDVLLELSLVRMRGRRRTPGRPVTYGTTQAFLEHYGLASLADLPGAAEMKAAGLLDMNVPGDFAIPDASGGLALDEDPLDPAELAEAPEFLQDFVGED
jgi:segregation and condensation protein B